MQKPIKAANVSKRTKAAKPAVADTGAIVAAPKTVERFGGLTAGQIGKRNDTVAAMRYPFATVSGRDDAYLVLFAAASESVNSRTVALSAIAALGIVQPNGRGRNPFAAAAIVSAPICDAGAIERASKRGVLSHDHAAGTITLTESGATLGSALLAKLAPAT